MRYVGQTSTDSHKRRCWVYEEGSFFFLLTRTTIPCQGQFYEFKKKDARELIRRLPKNRSFEIQEVLPHMSAVERNRVRNPALGRRADYFIQLMKILGRARYQGKSGRKLLYKMK